MKQISAVTCCRKFRRLLMYSPVLLGRSAIRGWMAVHRPVVSWTLSSSLRRGMPMLVSPMAMMILFRSNQQFFHTTFQFLVWLWHSWILTSSSNATTTNPPTTKSANTYTTTKSSNTHSSTANSTKWSSTNFETTKKCCQSRNKSWWRSDEFCTKEIT